VKYLTPISERSDQLTQFSYVFGFYTVLLPFFIPIRMKIYQKTASTSSMQSAYCVWKCTVIFSGILNTWRHSCMVAGSNSLAPALSVCQLGYNDGAEDFLHTVITHAVCWQYDRTEFCCRILGCINM